MSSKKKFILVGNPNVGKSALFQALSEQFVEVSNYPGTTVDTFKTAFDNGTELVDTPGVYSISSTNDEERITKESLRKLEEGNLVVNVVNATTLCKDLFLTLHLVDLQIPFVLVVNQIDEASDKGIEIDYDLLSSFLGVKVFPVSAVKTTGVEELKSFLKPSENGQKGNISPELKTKISSIQDLKTQSHTNPNKAKESKQNDFINSFDALMLLEEDTETQKKYPEIEKVGGRKKTYSKRRERADRLFERVVKTSTKESELQKNISRALIHPIFGTLIGWLVGIFFLYQVLGVWVAGDFVNLLEKGFFEKYWVPNVKYAAAHVFPTEISSGNKDFTFQKGILFSKDKPKENQIKISSETKFIFSPADLLDEEASQSKLEQNLWSSFGTILVGKYGLLTLAVTYLFGLLLPLIWFFYFSWAMLEDSGYLPRLAVLADGFLRNIGLNGRGVIPLVLGLGCVTMAVVTTRLMSNRREQLIMMILLGVAVPCSAQLGIIQSLLAQIGGFSGWLVWVAVILGVLLICGFLASKLLPGTPTPMLLELPPLRIPSWKNITKKANQKSWFFFQEAGIAFIWASLAVSVLQVTGGLALIINGLEPLVAGILHLPKEVALSFLMGMVRRDFGAFGLLELELTKIQVVTACVTLTLFVPCIATLAVMIKERNWKTALGIWCFAWLVGFGVGGLLTRLLEYIGFN